MGWGVPYLLPWALNDTRKSPFRGKEQKKGAMGRSVPKRWAQMDFSGFTWGDDDVFYLFLQKQKIGAKLHIYL
jgi:hypothetical protein